MVYGMFDPFSFSEPVSYFDPWQSYRQPRWPTRARTPDWPTPFWDFPLTMEDESPRAQSATSCRRHGCQHSPQRTKKQARVVRHANAGGNKNTAIHGAQMDSLPGEKKARPDKKGKKDVKQIKIIREDSRDTNEEMAVPVTNKTDAESEFDDSKPWRPLKILVDSGLERKNKAEDFKDCSKESKQETNTEIPLSEIQNEEGAITSENADSEIEYESADEGDNSDGQQMEVDGESNSSDAMDSLKLQDDQGDKSTTMEEGEESKPQSPEKSPSQGEPEQEEQVIEEQEEQVIEMKLQSIREQSQKARDLADRVLEFSGKKTDKEYLFLSEMLLRGILTLDEIETQGVETVKQARRGAVREIQGYLDKLEEKVS